MSCSCGCRWWPLSSFLMLVVALLTAFLVYKYVRHESTSSTIFSFLGAPGAGKGTLAEECVQKLGFSMLSTGNLIREHIQNQTDLGKKLQDYTKAGLLVPDEIVTAMVKEWISKNVHAGKPIILDGFPRTAAQAQLLLDMINHDFKGQKLRVVEIKVSDEDVVQRISHRIVCSNKQCQAVYNLGQFVGVEKPLCKICGAELMRREDDKEEVVRERLKVYAQSASGLINFYTSKGIHIEQIDGSSKTPGQVFESFKSMI